MRIIDTDYIIQNMRDENAFVLRCEELFHDKISTTSAKIITARDKGTRIVCLTGPSGSGKTTTAMRIRDYLLNLGVPVIMISMDNFFLPARKRPKDLLDWESPLCVDIDRLIDSLKRLSEGESVEMPTFDFTTSDYGPFYTEQGSKDAVIIAEGIHMLNPLIFSKLEGAAVGIYAAPRTRVLTKEEKVIHPQTLRIARRMLRDYNGRGRTLRQTVEKAEEVNEGEEKYIIPYRTNASIHIDTFHDYEPCILAQHLMSLPSFGEDLTDDFIQTHDLQDLIKLVQTIPRLTTKYVPLDSVLREFVGGSKYKY